jgi:SAM-dependent methyltransferase
MSSQKKSIRSGTGVDTRNLWNTEYGALQVIPSSTRPLPSKALLQYDRLLPFESIRSVLDVGCGNGRNAIYLASKGCQVDAIDSSPIALQLLRDRAEQAGVGARIKITEDVLGTAWPYADQSYDLVVDSFVSCHLLCDTDRIAYRDEMHRVTRKSGLAYSSLFSTDDEYYQPLLSTSTEDKIVIDPRNSIAKRLYEEEEVAEFYSEKFIPIYQNKFMFDDVVQGATYRRSILSLILGPR